MHTDFHAFDPFVLAQHVSAFLESPYKPFLMYLPFLPWAWLISSKLDKDARYFHFNYVLWNSLHLAAGVAALALMLFVPIFWIGWPAGMLILAAPIFFYWNYRNQRVPELQQFKLTGEGLAEKMEQRKQARAARDAVIQFQDSEGTIRKVPLKEDPLFPVHMLAEDLIGPAVEARASVLEIAIGANGGAAAQTVDGIRYKREPLPAEAGLQVVDYIKDMAGLDLQDRRRRQTGEFRMQGPGGYTELTATTWGSSKSVALRLDLDRANRLSKPFDGLGMLPAQREAIASLVEPHDRHGIVLVGAPTGQGLSTSMYSFIGRHDAYTSNIKTLERDILMRIDGVDHVQFDPTDRDVDFATGLQSMLRRDPDIILIGQIDDTETARTATDPGMQGPLMYVPQRATSISDQIRDWVKLVGDVKRATKALRAVTNQRLIRTLCPNCRQAYQPNADQLRKLNLPADKISQLYRPGGKVQVKNKVENCPVCGGTGYLGQTGIFEVFVVDSEARKLLGAGDLRGALAHARRNKMIYMQEAALSKVASGETSVEEVVRVTSSGKGAPSASSSEAVPAGS